MPKVNVVLLYKEPEKSGQASSRPLYSELEQRFKVVSYIEVFNYGQILPGKDRPKEIQEFVNHAHIVLAFLDSNFMDPEMRYSKEVELAIERSKKQELVLIPIFIEYIAEYTEFHNLKRLAANEQPYRVMSKNKRWANEQIFKEIIGIVRYLYSKNLLQEAESAIAKKDNVEGKKLCCLALNNLEALLLEKHTFGKEEAHKLYERLGKAFHELREFSLSIQSYEKSLFLGGDSRLIYELLGDIWRQWALDSDNQEKPKLLEKALNSYRRADPINNRDALLCKKIAECFMEQNTESTYGQALSFYETAEKFSSRDELSSRNIAECLYKLEKYPEAVERYKYVLECNPDDIYSRKMVIKLYIRLRKHSHAYQECEKALLSVSDDKEIWHNAGKALFRLERFFEAAQAFKRAIECESDNPYFYKELGDAYVSGEYFEEARFAFEEAIFYGQLTNVSFLKKVYLAKAEILEKLADQYATSLRNEANEARKKANSLVS